MNDELCELLNEGIFLLGADSELGIENVRILRAWLAAGFYRFAEKNRHRKSALTDREWMTKQADKMGVNY